MVEHVKQKDANIATSAESHALYKKLRVPFVGKTDRDTVPEMATQSLIQSKDLITPNTEQATESLDSAFFCVGDIKKKKQRIGVRLSISERRSLEIAAKENRLSVSDYVRTLIPKNIAA